MAFFTVPNAPRNDYNHAHEVDLYVAVPYIVLTVLAIFFGYVASDLFVGMGSDFLFNDASVFIHPSHITLVDAEFALST